jgi:threonine aldolase
VSTSAALSGVAFRYVAAQDRGRLTVAQVAAALAPDPYDVAVVDLVALENTHQVGGGSVLGIDELAAIAAVTTATGVPLYLDGARIFNACTAARVRVADYARHVDAMMFCLSKGLGAPIGSVLAGDAEFIREARRLKILFGAAWRQAGIMAAVGLIALAEGPTRLHEDHENARALAEGLAELLPGSVDLAAIETNIVFADVSGTGRDAWQWRSLLAAEGVLVTVIGDRVRMLTHVDVGQADIRAALDAWHRVAKSS